MEQNKETDKDKKGGTALLAASIGQSATAQAGRHSGAGLANTGTNISYEGATAPGAGGSAGTGLSSGKKAVDEKIHTNSDYGQNRGGSPSISRLEKEEDKGYDEYWEEDEMRRAS